MARHSYDPQEVCLADEVITANGFTNEAPYHDISELLIASSDFNGTYFQRLVPFLGAGASLAFPTVLDNTRRPPISLEQQAKDLETALCSELKLESSLSKDFLHLALAIACLLEQQQNRETKVPDPTKAPTSWQLANSLAEMLKIDPFKPYCSQVKTVLGDEMTSGVSCDKLVRAVAELFSWHLSIPQLLTMGSLFPLAKRGQLIGNLKQTFSKVTQKTPLQDVLALKAKQYISSKRSNYLIITTNYDSLIELALTKSRVPYVVIVADFDDMTHMQLGATEAFEGHPKIAERRRLIEKTWGRWSLQPVGSFDPTRAGLPPCVFLYKIHGDPDINFKSKPNNIVIGDTDYTRFIELNGRDNKFVPAYLRTLLSQANFLFLGYSFADWNVRSIYENMHESQLKQSVSASKGEICDYIVLRNYSSLDQKYFERYDDDMHVVCTSLQKLAERLK
jgi:hypothetical protein